MKSNSTSLKVPRIESLFHKLQRAKDAGGKFIPLLDDLLLFLDDPPPGTHDRWEEGAEHCRKHGIATSRSSVWSFYQNHILQWRREKNPASPGAAPSAEESASLQDEARHLAAQRVIEMLNDPRLSPGQLVGFLQHDNNRKKTQLAVEKFNDQLEVRARLEEKQRFPDLYNEDRDKRLIKILFKRARDADAIRADSGSS